MILEIVIKEVLQAGDEFLCRWFCPFCKEPNLTDYPIDGCSRCAASFMNPMYCFEKTNRRLLAGTYRKHKGGLGKKTIQAMIRMQANECCYCHEQMKIPNVEHNKPLAVGGTNQPSNLALAWFRCNSLAGAKFFKNFYEKQMYVLMRRSQAD